MKTPRRTPRARCIELNEIALWALGRLLGRAEKLGSTTPDHYLFPAYTFKNRKLGAAAAGSGYDPSRPMSGWRTAWRSLTKAAGLKGLRFHDLRHTAITKLAEGDIPSLTMQSMAGHLSAAMSRHYAHIREKAKGRAAQVLMTWRPPELEEEATKLVQ